MPRLGRATRIAPVIWRGASTDEVFFTAAFASTFAVYAPSVVPAGVRPPLVSLVPVVYQPSVNQKVTQSLVASTFTVYAPVVNNAGAGRSVEPDLPASTFTVYGPSMTAYVSPPTVSLMPSVWQPFVTPPALPNVTPALLTNPIVVYAPILGVPVTPDLLLNPIVVYAPTLSGNKVDVGLLTIGLTVYQPIGIIPEMPGSIFLRGRYDTVINEKGSFSTVIRKSGHYQRTLFKKGEYDT
jgi:hypothetical protein